MQKLLPEQATRDVALIYLLIAGGDASLFEHGLEGERREGVPVALVELALELDPVSPTQALF